MEESELQGLHESITDLNDALTSLAKTVNGLQDKVIVLEKKWDSLLSLGNNS